MTSKGTKCSNQTHSLSAFLRLSSSSLAKAYILRIILISALSLSIPYEVTAAESLFLATITASYAAIECIVCAYLIGSKLRSGTVSVNDLAFLLTLWLSALWLSLLAFSHAVLSDSLVVYDTPITYALEAILLALLIRETLACLRQNPAF